MLVPERISERSSTLKFGTHHEGCRRRCGKVGGQLRYNPNHDVRKGRRPEKVGHGSDTFFVFKGEVRAYEGWTVHPGRVRAKGVQILIQLSLMHLNNY